MTVSEHGDRGGESGGERTRTITWQDPIAAAGRALEMSGIERLRSYAAGEVPPSPFALTIDTDVAEFEEGRAIIAFQPAEFHYNIMGVVHAGVIAAVLDSAMGVAVQSRLPAHGGFVTLEINVDILLPMRADAGAISAEGTVLRLGSRIANAEGRATDRAGRIYAHATGTMMVMRP